MKSLILTSMLTAVSLLAAQSSPAPGTAAPKSATATSSTTAPAAPQTDAKKPVKRHSGVAHNKTDGAPKSVANTVKPAASGGPAASVPAGK